MRLDDAKLSEYTVANSGREQPVGEHAEVDHRRRCPPFPTTERYGEPNAADQQTDRRGRRKTPRRSLAQDQEQAQKRERAQERADQVELGASAGSWRVKVMQEDDRQQDAGDAERNADQEETSP